MGYQMWTWLETQQVKKEKFQSRLMQSKNIEDFILLEEVIELNYQKTIHASKKQLNAVQQHRAYIKRVFGHLIDHLRYQVMLNARAWVNWFSCKWDFINLSKSPLEGYSLGVTKILLHHTATAMSLLNNGTTHWLFEIFDRKILKNTRRQHSLPNWVINETSNQIKNNRRGWNKQKKPAKNVALKLKSLQQQLAVHLNADRKNIEDPVFINAQFSEIPKFIKFF